ncbi:hypothetical protein FJP11_20290 [Bacillus altitudinis]|nr:hypothetical protein [Bacillus altitudinis]
MFVFIRISHFKPINRHFTLTKDLFNHLSNNRPIATCKPDRLPDDDGGHLIASIFKGSGDIDNLLPMNSQINRSGGKWYNMEQEWLAALRKKPPETVSVNIEPVYKNDSMRPDRFIVKYSIADGDFKRTIIKNQKGG